MQKSQMIRNGITPPAKKVVEPVPAPPVRVRTSMDVRETFPVPQCISNAAVREAGRVYLNGTRYAALGDGSGWAIPQIEPSEDDECLADVYRSEARVPKGRRWRGEITSTLESMSRLTLEREREALLAEFAATRHRHRS